MTVVCIAGMHRSGTSMIAKLLNMCGVYLGSGEDLMPSDAYNAEGYWENLAFVEINNDLLSHVEASWSRPPASHMDYDIIKLPESLVQRARDLIRKFETKRLWGWKDPRSSLTLPFWQQLIPDLKVVVCIRNPLEVAQSLSNRDEFPASESFELWHIYNERLLISAKPEKRLITPYAAYFINPQEELQRVLGFLGSVPDMNTIHSAANSGISSLRHSHRSFAELIAAGAPLKVINLYMELSVQAQSPYWNILNAPDHHTGKDFERNLIDKLTSQDLVTQELISYLSKKALALEALEAELRVKQKELGDIYKSRAWQAVLRLRQIRQLFSIKK